MSIVDKIIAAVTPPESDDARREARAKAHSVASPGDWLSMVLEHHERIESAFVAVKSANSANAQIAAQKKLAIMLTGHANAEESVIYPALAGANEKGHATTAYTEQAAAKIQMGLLEKLPPMTTDYLEKLEHIRGCRASHVRRRRQLVHRPKRESAGSGPGSDHSPLRGGVHTLRRRQRRSF
jgi:hypothetical protein